MRRRYVPTLCAFALLLQATAFTQTALADDAACIAASEASLPLRKQGQLHAALQQLAVCADASCPDEVKSECVRRIDTLGAAMPTIVFAAKDGAGNDLFAVKATMDGSPLLDALDGRPIAVDPGEHTFRFETAGQAPVERKLVLREGEKDRHEGVVLGPAPVAQPMTPPPPPLPPLPPPSSWSTQKTLAIATGGVGIVGIGLGTVFGAYASSSQSREKRDCPTAGCAGFAQATEDYDAAKKDATGSTIAFVAGAALVAAGAVLWFTAPKEKGALRATNVRIVPAMLGRGAGVFVGGDL